MSIRRVVTGHDRNGKAIVLSDGPATSVKTHPNRPGHRSTDIWKTTAMPVPLAAEERILDAPREPDAGQAVPRAAARKMGRQLRRHVLAEEARHVSARRRQAVVEGRGDQHFHDRLARPAMRLRVHESEVHVGEARRDDDAGGVMLGRCPSRQAGEIRQLGERHVHAERAGAAAPILDTAPEVFR
mgnify:CR=1 FL=1